MTNIVKIGKYEWLWPEQELSGYKLWERILAGRLDKIDWDNFLDPVFVLADPFLMKDMSLAVDRIVEAKSKNQIVGIYGDYDVDGVTSTALMKYLFDFVGIETKVFIPNRFEHGYGLNISGIKDLVEQGADLVISVDCGIKDIETVERARKMGLDIVITDHHTPGDVLPTAVAVVDPKRVDSEYPERELAGVGVAFTFARALLERLEYSTEEIEWFVKWQTDLVALGTVADMVPLVGENRVLVSFGLRTLVKTKKPGLKKLCQIANVDLEKLDTDSIGYAIGPRLNAAGRMKEARLAYDLLIADNDTVATNLCLELEEHNKQRRSLVDGMIKDVETKNLLEHDHAVIIANDGWSRGVVGLAASRLVDRFNKPVILGEITGDVIVGSVRGVEGFPILKWLGAGEDLLIRYGGHEMAGGFSIKKENWQLFIERMLKYIENDGFQTQARKMNVDAIASLEELNFENWEILKKIRPYGLRNEEPVIVVKDLLVEEAYGIGKEQRHLKLRFKDKKGKRINCIYWSASELSEILDGYRAMDVAMKIREDNYRDRPSLSFQIVDMNYHEE